MRESAEGNRAQWNDRKIERVIQVFLEQGLKIR
jgi:hypothetical protein